MNKIIVRFMEIIAMYSYVVIDIILKFITYITIPIFATLMTPEEYGQYYLMLSYVAIISIFINLNVSTGTVLLKTRDDFIDTIAQLRILLLGTGILLMVIIFMSALNYIDISFAIIIIVASFFQALINSMLEKERAFQRVRRYSFIKATMNVLAIVLSIILIKYFPVSTFVMRSWGLIIAMFFTVLIFIGGIVVRSDKNFIEASKVYIKYSIPLIPFALSSTMLVYFDRIVLDIYRPESELGLYSFSYNIAMVISMVALGLNKSLQPKIYQLLKISDEKNIHVSLKKYNIAFLFALTIFSVFFPLGLKIMKLGAYSGSFDVIFIIVASQSLVFYYAINSNFIYYTGNTKLISFSTLGATVINLVLNMIFIPQYGYIAAAITTYVSYLILAFTIIFISCSISGVNVRKENSLKYLFFSQGIILLIWRGIYACY
ncbi:oligosaccharide flippase family protein [Peptostreptococcaceae bacterium AGR-M142]